VVAPSLMSSIISGRENGASAGGDLTRWTFRAPDSRDRAGLSGDDFIEPIDERA